MRGDRDLATMPSSSAAISCQGVTKSYGAHLALRGIDLEVPEGEVFGFLGPNGAGKTTLIRCLLNMICPDGGNLQVLGRCPQMDSVAVRAETGYLPGELKLDPALTVGQTLTLFRRMRGGSVSLRKVNALAERLQLDQSRPIRHLSKGNKQKVGIIQAMMHEPRLLILDEPTSGLDPLMQREVLTLVQEAKARGASVFFSSHLLSETEEVADRAAIVRAGEVVVSGETSALMRNELVRVSVTLERAIAMEVFDHLPNVWVMANSKDRDLALQVRGDLDALMSALAGHGVQRFEPVPATLEDVFLSHYLRMAS